MTAFVGTAEYGTAELPGGQQFTITADAASFALSGKAALTSASVILDPASLVLTGQTITMTSAIGVAPAAFALSVLSSITSHSFTIDPAAFALSGQASEIAMPVGSASFTISAPAILFPSSFSAGAGAFVLTGQDAAFIGTLDAGAAAFAYTTQDTQFAHIGERLAASFDVLGYPIFWVRDIGLNVFEPATAEYGTAEFPRYRVYGVDARPAAFAWTGPDTLLTEAPVAAEFVLTPQRAEAAMAVDAAVFNLSGQEFLGHVHQTMDPAVYVLNGQNIVLFAIDSGTHYTVSGQDAILASSLNAASFSLTPVAVFQIQGIGTSAASFALDLKVPDLLRTILAEVGNFTVVGWNVSDLTGPTGDHVYLIQVQAHNGTEVVTFYLSTDGFTSQSYDDPANQYYMPRIMDAGNFEQSLFEGSDLRGRSSSGAGDVRISNADPGNGETLDDWFGYGWSQREIRILSVPRGDKSLSSAATLFVGKAERVSSTRPLDYIDIKISDRLSDLRQPLLTDLYAGTTTSTGATAEGNSDLKGKIKQKCWGVCYNVPVQPVNPYDLIYLVSDGALYSITLYDGGAALTNAGDDADLATLQAATIAAGSYRTCLALGLVRTGATPEKQLTADIIESSDVNDHTAGQIVYRMLDHFGFPTNAISTGHIDIIDAANGSECGYFVDDNRECLSAVQEVLDSIGAWMVPNVDGTLIFGVFREPGESILSPFDVDTQGIGQSLDFTDAEIPVWRVILEYAPVFRAQNDSELLASVSDERRAYLADNFRTVFAEDTSVKIKHLSAREITVRSYLNGEASAQAECDRLLDLLKTERQRVNVTFPLSDAWVVAPGESLTLTHPRLNWDAGKAFRVLRRVNQYSTDSVQFSLWG